MACQLTDAQRWSDNRCHNTDCIPCYHQWIGQPRDDVFNGFEGFIYIIYNTITGQYYIGQKKFRNKRMRMPLKGKKNKRHYEVQSDWKDYWGSCQELLDDIKKYGKHQFIRKILYLCNSKAYMNYLETKIQFERDVLRDPLSYNRIINCRISANQLGYKG